MKKEIIKLSKIQKEVLVGSLLGDGALAKRKENRNARYHVRMSFNHENEIMQLYSVFNNLVKTPPKLSITYNSKTNKEYKVWSFMTLSYPCLNEYRELFYPNGIKIVPQNIQELLSARGLAQWVMDDGSKDGSGLRLYTNNFSLDNVNVLKYALKNTFCLNSEITFINKKKNPNQYKIYIKKDSMDRLRQLVKEFLTGSMYYKIS